MTDLVLERFARAIALQRAIDAGKYGEVPALFAKWLELRYTVNSPVKEPEGEKP